MINQWDSHIKNYLLAEGIKKGSIHALDGKILAASHNFAITVQESKSILARLSAAICDLETPLSIAGLHYRLLRRYNHFVYGQRGWAGCILAHTPKALIVAIHDEKTHATTAASCVVHLANRLSEDSS